MEALGHEEAEGELRMILDRRLDERLVAAFLDGQSVLRGYGIPVVVRHVFDGMNHVPRF